MSLKAFHIVFIGASTLLSFGVGVWAFVTGAEPGQSADRIFGALAFLVGITLIVYGVRFLRKLRNVGFL
ncbi:MAG: hypothetical protein HY304_02570 [candidate division Zixibacteria bacterium]|nr:hypothetical protein [candidate division Zixibacteria bacterium]